MMRKGGFNLRKSYSETVFKVIPESQDLKVVQNEEIKILGIQIRSLQFQFLFQELWKLNLEWDDPIPEDLYKQWTAFRKELHLIEKMKIPRIIAWTDSTITLAWLNTEPYHWQPFVANRVSKIQTIPSVEWCHVSGIENPADLGTRELLPSQLLAYDQWIQGPLWLNQPINETSSYKIPETFSFSANALKEKRNLVTCVAKIEPLSVFTDRIFSFTKLIRVCAWILRFKEKQ
ncbi:integrase catalytic domain-containing protein [Trichonephila inaurata madagascariensis]|uniref:Integrase catalytic domain-containing protein n=1 Tax=Trichonephila inaurata madagascariensis TaxID=2747483 RepID=A0A8X6IJQ4_9ARAC|nr:integrase catalytic domain-containing protein [Trichonephila inaurata madagascariensis]